MSIQSTILKYIQFQFSTLLFILNIEEYIMFTSSTRDKEETTTTFKNECKRKKK